MSVCGKNCIEISVSVFATLIDAINHRGVVWNEITRDFKGLGKHPVCHFPPPFPLMRPSLRVIHSQMECFFLHVGVNLSLPRVPLGSN